MGRLKGQRGGWASIFRHSRDNDSLAEELRVHLQLRADDLERGGLPRTEAERRARLEFGAFERYREASHEQVRGHALGTLARDLRYGLRMLRRTPGLTAVIIGTLALGIGANTAIFSLVNAVLLRSMPVADPGRLMLLEWRAHQFPDLKRSNSYGDCGSHELAGGGISGCSLSSAMFQEMAGRRDLFSGVAAFAGPAHMDLSGNGPATMTEGELVSGSYFETLGISAALGRILSVADNQPGAAPVAVLDYGYWQRAFGGEPSAVGRTIRLNNVIFTIVGVADPRFTRLTPGKQVDFWVPLRQVRALGIPWGEEDINTDHWWLTTLVRLRPDVTRVQAESAANLAFVQQTLHGAKPVWKKDADPQLLLLPAEQGLIGFRHQFGQPLLLLMAAVGLVLLIACANVAGLLLARGAARQREMAVRLAIGASRSRVMRQLLTESLLLSMIGAALGTVLAYGGAAGLTAFFSQNARSPLAIDLRPNALMLLFTIGVTVLTGVGFGLAPAWRGARADVAGELKGSAGTTTSAGHSGRRFGLGSALVVLQVALAVVVLAGAGLLVRTLDKLRSVDAGFDTHNVLLFTLEPELAGYRSPAAGDLYVHLQQRLAALPGVQSVSYASEALLSGSLWIEDVRVQGSASQKTVDTQMLAVGPDYFATMKIPVAMGRALQAVDMSATSRSAVVNRAFVRKFLGGRNPLGLHFGGEDAKSPQWEIVGVVGDMRYQDLRSDEDATAFIPLEAAPGGAGGATFALRTAADPAGLMVPVRQVVNETDNNLPVIEMRTQTDSIDQLLFNERLVARLFGLFGVLALALTAIGLYGLLSYEVARRTREIGIRTALGAQRRTVLLMVLRQGLVLVAVGAVAGTAAAAGLTRLLASLLFGVHPGDPVTFAAVAALLAAVSALACWIPARRATRVDPMVALRYE